MSPAFCPQGLAPKSAVRFATSCLLLLFLLLAAESLTSTPSLVVEAKRPADKREAREAARICRSNVTACIDEWAREHPGKPDSRSMTGRQLNAFLRNLARIVAVNEDPATKWWADVTDHMEEDADEWLAARTMRTDLLGSPPQALGADAPPVATVASDDSPPPVGTGGSGAIDWRNNPNTKWGTRITNFVTGVRQQGRCGCCSWVAAS